MTSLQQSPPTTPLFSSRTTIQKLNNLGMFKEQGDLSAAIASYNTALQLKSNYPEAHNNWVLLSWSRVTSLQQSPPTTPLFSSVATQKL